MKLYSRQTSLTVRPPSTYFRIQIICVSVNLDLFMMSSPYWHFTMPENSNLCFILFFRKGYSTMIGGRPGFTKFYEFVLVINMLNFSHEKKIVASRNYKNYSGQQSIIVCYLALLFIFS
jgi:hypothetical protein